MISYLIRRMLWAIVLFFAVTIVSYVLFYIIPADPAKPACGQSCTEVEVKRVKHFLGLDRPIYVQYGNFVGDCCRSTWELAAALQDAQPGQFVLQPTAREQARARRRSGDRLRSSSEARSSGC